MEKKDKSNFIIYLVLCLISFLIAGYGYILNISGFGSSGKIKKELSNIITVFNDISYIKNNAANIEATYKNKGINVKYETDRVDINYQFTYENILETKILTIKYTPNDASKVEEIIKGMLDASSIINGNQENALFENYKYTDFFSANLQEHGVEIRLNNGTITTRFVINENILKKLQDAHFGEDLSVPHITYEELTNLNSDLEIKKTFLLEKETMMIYAVNKEPETIIYVSDSENNETNTYETTMSAIKRINENIYKEILTNKIKFTANYEGNNYKIEINPTKIENNHTMNSDKVIKITIMIN